MNTYTWATFSLALGLLALGLVWVWQWLLRRRKKVLTEIRPILAFQNLQDEMKRAVENGKTIHIALGSGGLGSEATITTLASLQVVEALVDIAATYDVSPIITVGDPTLLPLVQDTLRRAYERRDLAELYESSMVRFVAPSPVAYAAGSATVLATEDVTANILVGYFGPEASLITGAGSKLGLPQFAAADTPTAVGALYPTTRRLAMGEELYAAGAQMTEERRYRVSLAAQDLLRLIVVGAIVAMAVLTFLRSLGI